jgi:hypothetical protein
MGGPVRFGSRNGRLLRCDKNMGNVMSQMNSPLATVDILTSARMAAGMTSRARRPMTFKPVG